MITDSGYIKQVQQSQSLQALSHTLTRLYKILEIHLE